MELTFKKINFLGDSITEGHGSSGKGHIFCDLVGEAFGAEVRNYGIGGTRFAKQTKPSDPPVFDLDFCTRATEMDADADIVVVFDDTIMDKHVDVGQGCNEDTILVLNTSSADVVEKYRNAFGFKTIYWSDGTGAAIRNIGLSIPNSAMLGALAKTGIVTIDAVCSAIKDSFGKVGEKNVNAAREAYEHTEKA